MRTLWQDLRYGLRMLAKNPGFTAVVVVILGVAIGATTAMLSVIDAVLLQPCPYKNPDSLVCLYETDGAMRTKRTFTSRPTFEDWRERNHVFSHLVGANQRDLSVRGSNGTEMTRAMFVSPEFFSVLGAQPLLGRTFLPEEERRGGERVAILSYTHWQRWFGSDPNALGKTIIVDGQAHTVVGVLSREFRWIFQGWACGLWMPMSLDPDQGMNRGARGLKAIGRLRPGVSLSQAQAEMDLIAAQIAQEHPSGPGAGSGLWDEAVALVPINRDSAQHAVRSGKVQALVIVLAIVVCVLLIACLHIASLLIARSAAREREIAVRVALGARRLRLVRQLLTESALLAGAGALLGLVLAYWGLAVLSSFRGQYIPWYGDSTPNRLIPWFTQVYINGRVLFYMVGISLLTCGLFGMLPAIGASAIHLSRSLSVGRAPVGGPRFQSLRALLVIGDIAIAVVLLTGAGLMINSYIRIVNIDPGYDPTDVLSLTVVLDEEKPPYSASQRRLAFFEGITEQVCALPGVRLAAAASSSPVDGTGNVRPFKIEGVAYDSSKFRIEGLDDMLPDRSYMWFPYWEVLPDYFRVVQIPLLKGRRFTEQDTTTSQPVVIISEALAGTFWPNGNPVGQYLIQAPPRGDSAPVAREIVGVVGDAKHFGRSEPSDPDVYVPYGQAGCSGWMTLTVRMDPVHKEVAGAIRREIVKTDPDVMIASMSLMDRDISGFWSAQRSLLFCLGSFATVGLILACLGVYGTTVYAVSRRTHEIGIRIALGARSSDVLRTVLRQGLRLTAIGLVIGLAGAFAATRVIRSFLYDVSATDLLTFVSGSLLLAGVALLACYLPARRAARIDPMEALRYE